MSYANRNARVWLWLFAALFVPAFAQEPVEATPEQMAVGTDGLPYVVTPRRMQDALSLFDGLVKVGGSGPGPNGLRLGVDIMPGQNPKAKFHVNTSTLVPAAGLIPGGQVFLATSSSDGSTFTGVAVNNVAAGTGGYFRSIRARGTLDAPLAVQAGDIIFDAAADGWDGDSRVGDVARIIAVVAGPVSNGQIPTRWTIATSPQTGGVALGFPALTVSSERDTYVHGSRFGLHQTETLGVANGDAASSSKLVKAVAGIPDGTSTTVLTVTVPNAAQSAVVRVTLIGSIGSGGAVGVNEASGVVSYDFVIARTAGVSAVVGASGAFGSASVTVAGAATIVVTASASAAFGGAGAVNVFTIDAIIAKGGGSSASHTCLVLAEVLNANASGVTIQ